ncbi:MAG TPA: efflux RND transporter periplasmic adaptor subunit [Thermoanaerobaculia bacterium]|nr:efflux RND transporter periplasmic adaptor subunit [Thermoanaerobaculia bacterium]
MKRINNEETQDTTGSLRKRIVAMVVVLLVALAALACGGGEDKAAEKPAAGAEAAEGEKHEEGEAEGLVELTPEAAAAAGIQYAQVTQRTAIAPLKATGTIEANQQRMQQVTPLVSGRVERVTAVAGDRVGAGAVLAILSSPEIAELHGKELEAQARVSLAQSNLRRLRKLSELGAAAGKDLAAAESEAATAQAEVAHIRASLASLGSDERVKGHSISSVALRAPISGTITERMVNAGAGVQAGTPLFSIADLSTVWVIANVPEAQISNMRIGTAAEVRSPALGQSIARGRVTYIDPVLNEQTRTARVRLEVMNPNQQLRIGTFVEVNFEAGAVAQSETATELVVPDEAIQTVENKTIVFVPDAKPNHFQMREIQVGGQADGVRKVVAGLTAGERVVTKGSFVLKTQMLKGEMGEHGH